MGRNFLFPRPLEQSARFDFQILSSFIRCEPFCLHSLSPCLDAPLAPRLNHLISITY